jgi:ribosomal protection tetracycline resistance protein
VRTLNLGILAHVDAGKTTLTERLLYAAGVIDEIGSVDDGTTQTDFLALEQQRGITIKSAVVSFAIDDVTVNLIDTPGHPDFIAEVERVLSVLDGALLVISAVEGVQAQTRVLMRTLQRLSIPTLMFVNKIDRGGAAAARTLQDITEKLDPAIIAMGPVGGLGSRGASTTPYTAADADFTSRLVSVFKIERGPAGEKIAYVRMFSGTVRVRDRLRHGDHQGKVTAIGVFDHGSAVQQSSVAAGQIGKLSGLGKIQVGDAIGASPTTATARQFGPPTLETVVVPTRPGARGELRVALTQLAEQDPLINVRQDDPRQEIYVSLYGEVQKEVIQATLADDYGIDVTFRESTTICIERPTGFGAAFEIIDTLTNPFLATVGLRIDPAPVGSGVAFRLEVELGSMPLSFFRAVEETVRATLREGRHGWQVVDCMITMTHSGYWAKQSHAHAVFDKSMSSTARDFRNLTPLVVMDALQQAGTSVFEPIHRFRLEVPADTLGAVLYVLAQLGAVPHTPAPQGTSYLLEGGIAAARVHELQLQLATLTRGEGVLESAFERYELVRGVVPTRARTDHNPLDRKEYFLHALRRI